MTQFYIYTYQDPRTNVYRYVGKGTGPRAYTHLNKTHNKMLAFLISELKQCGMRPTITLTNCNSENEALQTESVLIAKYGRNDLGQGTLFNFTDRGDQPPSSKGRIRSEEHKRKLSIAGRGRKRTTEQIEKMRAYNTGRHHTEDTKQKMSKSRTGVPFTEQHKANLKESLNNSIKKVESGARRSKEMSIGTYHTPFGEFASSSLASRGTGLSRQAIINMCVKYDITKLITVHSIKNTSFPSGWIGKTYRDVGFYFTPK